jgi:exodeoxyribonuclease V alpha subunit
MPHRAGALSPRRSIIVPRPLCTPGERAWAPPYLAGLNGGGFELEQAVARGTAAPIETLSGLVERVTFHSLDSRFWVLRVKPAAAGSCRCRRACGRCHAGEFISACQRRRVHQRDRRWVNDREHGLQFKATHIATTQPTTIEGIETWRGFTAQSR